jgi:hypothetical protein
MTNGHDLERPIGSQGEKYHPASARFVMEEMR